MRQNRFQIADVFSSILVLTILLLSACGGGGGSTAGGGIGGTGVIASGAITDKGSVHVNGVIYTTTDATITLDDTSGTDADIRRGMVVRVDGSIESNGTDGTADFVTYEDVVEGPLTFSSAQPSSIVTLTVLGQTVIVEEGITYVDDGTVSAPDPLPQTLPDFATVNYLEVSGFRDASAINGAIRATYIEIKSTLTEYEVKGVVENADSTSFEIAGLQVNISTPPANGTLVEVKGPSSGFFTAPDTLVATSVETRTAGLGETEVEHAEVEGFVTSFNTPVDEFKLNGQAVNYAGANFEGGTIGDLADGVKVEAEGSISGGILIADKIEFKESIRFEGNAINVNNPISSAIEVEGLEGSGLVIFIDSTLTEIEDVNGNPGTISSLSDGYELKIRGRDSTGGIVATRIKVISITKADKVSLQGPATSVPPPANSVEVLNSVTVDTSSALFKFFDATDTEISSTQFYAQLEQDNVVKVKGDLNLGTSVITWNEIELED